MPRLGAFLGHLFPVWLAFRGGKGVATYLGCLIALTWQAALAFVAIWVAVAALCALFVGGGARREPGHSAASSAARPSSDAALVFAGLTALLWIMHRANIARLMAGTEGKIGRAA